MYDNCQHSLTSSSSPIIRIVAKLCKSHKYVKLCENIVSAVYGNFAPNSWYPVSYKFGKIESFFAQIPNKLLKFVFSNSTFNIIKITGNDHFIQLSQGNRNSCHQISSCWMCLSDNDALWSTCFIRYGFIE